MDTDAIILCHDIAPENSVSIAYSFDEHKVLEHIGYRFLASDYPVDNNVIVRFIERELLALLLSSDVNQTLVYNQVNGLSILLNGQPIRISVLQDRRSLLHLLNNNQGIKINYLDGKNYAVSILLDKGQLLSFNFPADSELITGMDKMERDIRLAVQLKNHTAKSNRIVAPDYSFLQLLRDTIYVDKGDSFMIPQINNDVFYKKIDNSYSLVFDSRLLAETFSNTLIIPADMDYTVDITHRMYGKRTESYIVNSRDFDDYFSRDFDRYFGIETLEKEKLTGTLILDDSHAGSIHLAFVSISIDNLLNGGTMEMQLYSNIPQNNIKTLFGK